MAINLATKYSEKIANVFTTGSFVAGKTSTEWDFSGVKSVKIITPQTVDPTPYNRSGTSRYGTPQEMQDTVQELVMEQDYGFSLIIDKGNNTEQQLVKNAGKMIKLETDEKIVPLADKHAIKQYIYGAGTVQGMTKPTKETIVEALNDACSTLDDANVPSENRYIYITGEMYKLLRTAPEFLGLESLGTDAIKKGVVGEVFDAKVVKVPTSYLPADAYFLVCHKNAVIMPYKIKDAKIHQDPPGISGALLEGRNLFDAFVIGARANAVYAGVKSGTLVADPAITITSHSAAITCATGSAVIKYITDGSDPRYSDTALTYAGAVTTTADTVVKAYAAKEGLFPSGVASKKDA